MQRIIVIAVLIAVLVAGIAPGYAQDESRPVITPENAAQLAQLALVGRGKVLDAAWSPVMHMAAR